MLARKVVKLDYGGETIQCSWDTALVTRFHPAASDDQTPIQIVDLTFSTPEASDLSSSTGSLPGPGDDNVAVPAETLPSEADLGGPEARLFLLACLDAAAAARRQQRGREEQGKEKETEGEEGRKGKEEKGDTTVPAARSTTTARLIIPLREGTIVRADIVPLRLRDAFWAARAASFSGALRRFPAAAAAAAADGNPPGGVAAASAPASLPELFRAAAGAVLLAPSTRAPPPPPPSAPGGPPAAIVDEVVETDFEADFARKLGTLPWVLPDLSMDLGNSSRDRERDQDQDRDRDSDRRRRRRLVLVGTSVQDPAGGGWTQFACAAAAALGVDLVVVVVAGAVADCWLARPEYASWYEALLPLPPLPEPEAPPTRAGGRGGEEQQQQQRQKQQDEEDEDANDDADADADAHMEADTATTADRLVALVAAYGRPVDGMVTFAEALQAAVGRAAARLGLPVGCPSCPPDSTTTTATSSGGVGAAVDKHRLGVFAGRASFAAPADAAAAVRVADVEVAAGRLRYPLVLKPRLGLNSEGVWRADSRAELLMVAAAAAAADGGRRGRGRFLIEEYCAGPEVDVNVVLIDGEAVFCEVCDDFPKTADDVAADDDGADTTGAGAGAGAGASSSWRRRTFHETNMAFPSALPPDELAMMRRAVVDAVLRLGFRSGVLHVEARVENSAVGYRRLRSSSPSSPPPSPSSSSPASGVLDLAPVEKEPSSPPPKPWIIEVNPRPPGIVASQLPQSVYGIDYWGVALLLAVGDDERARALARPFAGAGPHHHPYHHHHQHHGVLVLISAEFGGGNGNGDEEEGEVSGEEEDGVFDSDDVAAELLARRPGLAPSVGRHGCLLRRGQRVPHPRSGRNVFVAYFCVLSRAGGRREALRVADEIRREVRYTIRWGRGNRG
ncbi:hypothetical protein GGR56DRAFT_697007 [Xylariaceae sp. FL0804]|nr:hypothetical protein GGR56DRAFT_697007 [Xylariaceae sp. FL0804]